MRLIEHQKAELQGYIDTVEAEKEHMMRAPPTEGEDEKSGTIGAETLLPEVAAQTEALARLRDHGKQVLENQLAALRGSTIFSSASISQLATMVREVEDLGLWVRNKQSAMREGGLHIVLHSLKKWAHSRMIQALSQWRRLVRAKRREDAGTRMVVLFLAQKKTNISPESCSVGRAFARCGSGRA